MAKTSYIIVVNPQIAEINAINPETAEREYRKTNPGARDVAVIPRNAFKLNGKRIPFKKGIIKYTGNINIIPHEKSVRHNHE